MCFFAIGVFLGRCIAIPFRCVTGGALSSALHTRPSRDFVSGSGADIPRKGPLFIRNAHDPRGGDVAFDAPLSRVYNSDITPMAPSEFTLARYTCPEAAPSRAGTGSEISLAHQND